MGKKTGKEAPAHSSLWQLYGHTAELLQRVTLISFSYEDNEEGHAWQDLAEGF